MKVTLEQIESTLAENKLNPDNINAIINDLKQVIEEEKAEKEKNKLPKVKSEHLVFVNTPEGVKVDEMEAWVVTYTEGTDSGTVLQKIRDAVKAQNEATVNKKSSIDNLGEAFQGLKPLFLKGAGIKIKTKESVRVIGVNGRLL